MQKSIILLISLVLTAGCVNATQNDQTTQPYRLVSCQSLGVAPDLPDREYYQTGAVFAVVSGLTYTAEALCVADCVQEQGTNCAEKCEGIGVDPIQIYTDPYEPHNPALMKYLPRNEGGPHRITGVFDHIEVDPLYWDSRTKFNRTLESYMTLRNAEIVYDGAQTLKGNFVLYGTLDVNNQTKRVEGLVTAIYNGTSVLRDRPLLDAQMKVEPEEICVEFESGNVASLPIHITETSQNGDAVDFKILMVNATPTPANYSITLEKRRSLVEAIGSIASTTLRTFSLLIVYSDREYDWLDMGTTQTWNLNIALPPEAKESFAGYLYVRADNAPGSVIPVFIKPT